jgi:hypothetical protein
MMDDREPRAELIEAMRGDLAELVRMEDSDVLHLGERSGTLAEHLKMDAAEPYLPVDIREDIVTDVIRAEAARAGRALVMVDGKETIVPFSFFEEAEDFTAAYQAYVDWWVYVGEWHKRAAERGQDAIHAIEALHRDLESW